MGKMRIVTTNKAKAYLCMDYSLGPFYPFLCPS